MSNILTNNINPRSGNKITIGGVNDTVSIAGTVTYEDVTSVDSIGIITARQGVVIGTGASIGNPANNELGLYTNSSERVRIDSSGNVGLGTISPARQFTIYDSVTPIIQLVNSTTGNTANDGLMLYESGTNFVIENQENGEIRFHTNGAKRATIDSSGRLLLGTSSSSAKTSAVLEGNSTIGTGDARLILALGDNAPVGDALLGILRFTDTSHSTANTSAADITVARDGGTWTTGTSMPGRLVFSTTADGASSPTERMRITNNGRVNIVSSYTTGSPQFYVENATSSSGQQGVQVKLSSSSDNTSSFIYIGSSNGNKFYVYGNGNVVNSNNSYGPISSDQRLKQDISDANSQWDDIKNIRITNFHYKNDPAGPLHLGPIAQELEQVSPGLITRRPVSDDEIVDPSNDLIDGDEVLSFKSSILYMKAVKALQEAMERIEALEASNTDLLARVFALEGN